MKIYLVTVTSREAPFGVQTLYLLAGAQLGALVVEQLTQELLHDPVVQIVRWRAIDAIYDEALPAGVQALEIAYLPGVTDNEGESVLEGARRLGVSELEHARALRRHLLAADADSTGAAGELANDLVQTTLCYRTGEPAERRRDFYRMLVTPPQEATPQIARISLRKADDEELLRISRAGILALDLAEMRTVRDYFSGLGRDPSDGELETIAQTWSEHCSHKSFKARVRYRAVENSEFRIQNSEVGAANREPRTENREPRTEGAEPTSVAAQHAAQHGNLYPMLALLEQGEVEIDSLIRTFLMAATRDVLAARKGTEPRELTDDWVLSAFVDNAGIVAFGDDYEISFKVETHNHPSALEPFGGANTGVGGVIRDVLGVSAEPIANTDVLCFGLLDTPSESLADGVLPPQRVATGVVAGVRDYGNKLGIPTVNGAVLFEPGYTANPLVFCGTLGLAPRGSNPRNVQPGDAVVVLGGRTGRDGIHGATFSSIELTHTTASEVGSAVQIGDPITEKKMLDVLLQARDRRLYSAITDCGAGGLSSAVGEMGAETGVRVELETVALKYPGLQPWEIWLSEAQERLVLAVPQASLAAFLTLCAAEDVEARAIGTFTDDNHLRVFYRGAELVDLTMHFLHDGRPQRVLDAVWQEVTSDRLQVTGYRGRGDEMTADDHLVTKSYSHLVKTLLAHPNIASKERIVRSYDHEVRGGTVLKPLVGVACDGPGDAAVLQPLRDRMNGVALGCGINPRYGQIDPYWMALACVDEALRNVVAVGGDPDQTAILDNFCWGDPKKPDRMAGLVRAAAGCYDAALAFGTPYISGKDSLNNEYSDASGVRVAIPPTLLISALAAVPDVRQSVSMDLKEAGNAVYLVGATRDELWGSHLEEVRSQKSEVRSQKSEVGRADDDEVSVIVPVSSGLPRVDLAAARATFRALHAAIRGGLVRACHDLSEGGLAVAAAEMAFAGGLGLRIDLAGIAVESEGDAALVKLFSETPSRFLVEVRPDDTADFESRTGGVTFVRVGTTTDTGRLLIVDADVTLIDAANDDLKAAWQRGLDDLDV
jgi:phosphoribosylformylglycinamidine synthase